LSQSHKELKEIVERKRKSREAFLAEVTRMVEGKMKEHIPLPYRIAC
jgi:hypothetical protein